MSFLGKMSFNSHTKVFSAISLRLELSNAMLSCTLSRNDYLSFISISYHSITVNVYKRKISTILSCYQPWFNITFELTFHANFDVDSCI